jgi:hypothetical protein
MFSHLTYRSEICTAEKNCIVILVLREFIYVSKKLAPSIFRAALLIRIGKRNYSSHEIGSQPKE